MVVIDSHSEANQDDATTAFGAGRPIGLSQSFTMLGTNHKITSSVWYLANATSATGNIVSKLYAHSGTYGTSSVPTGAALATSDQVDVSTIGGSLGLVTFTFTGAQQYEMSASTYYVITVEDVDCDNNITAGGDWTSPTHSGNAAYRFASWTADSNDYCFYVYGDAVGGGLSIPVAMHHYNEINRKIRG